MGWLTVVDEDGERARRAAGVAVAMYVDVVGGVDPIGAIDPSAAGSGS